MEEIVRDVCADVRAEPPNPTATVITCTCW
jgi:hypothetical protein